MAKKILFSVAALLSVAAFSQAQQFLNPNLLGTTTQDVWGSLNSTTFPGYGGYPGTAAWPNPIVANIEGGGASLNKVTGSGYLSTTGGSYIYSTLSGGQTTNTSPANIVGTFAITDTTPVANLETVVFQIQISYWENVGTPFPTGVLPTLTLNGGGSPLPADISLLTYSGSFSSEYGSGVADWWLFQWDVRELGPIDSFAVSFSVTNHAQTYALQLNQSDVFTAVPEPHEYALAIGALLAGVALARRRGRMAA